ncbi:hypothetical protein [Paenibacillus sp. 481]|uniref:hypothetical protein n=1 Tax=Paenibacillus sp. 481 TaxID=2835869 RepID=UPI001E33B945|nr:hypothetical protein [Paenibacillus sp. 481]UHA72894.1 hypothetical protein KIK04_20070 [Paenibacillus sp. 481]
MIETERGRKAVWVMRRKRDRRSKTNKSVSRRHPAISNAKNKAKSARQPIEPPPTLPPPEPTPPLIPITVQKVAIIAAVITEWLFVESVIVNRNGTVQVILGGNFNEKSPFNPELLHSNELAVLEALETSNITLQQDIIPEEAAATIQSMRDDEQQEHYEHHECHEHHEQDTKGPIFRPSHTKRSLPRQAKARRKRQMKHRARRNRVKRKKIHLYR